MIRLGVPAAAIALLLCNGCARAQEPVIVGGDIYVSGANASLNVAAARDAFLAGFAVDVDQRVEKDVSAAAFDIDVSAPVGGDAYLAGFSIDVGQGVTEDLSAAGFNIQVEKGATIGGNARLAGGTVTVDGPIAGSLVASAGTFNLNAAVSGDVRLVTGGMTFGDGARINGKLIYSAAKPIVIPPSVIDPGRVTFQQLATSEGASSARETARESMPFFWWTISGVIFVFALSIAFLMALTAALLAFMPHRMEALRLEAIRAPVKTMALGVLGLSMSIGLVPVSAMTLIGIPLIPFAILAAIVLWVLGYISGAYVLAVKMLDAFYGQSTSVGSKLLSLFVVFIFLALLNFIPIVGWLINLAIVFLGLGSLVLRAARSIAHEDMQPIAPPPVVPEVSASSRRSRK